MKKTNNTTVRIIVAIIGIPVILGFCLWGGWPFVLFTGVIALASLYEFNLLLSAKGIKFNLILGFPFTVILLLNAYLGFAPVSNLFVGFILILLFYELFRKNGSEIMNLGGTLLGVFYIGFFTAHLIYLREFYTELPMFYERGGYLIITVMATIWICDSAAYFLGLAFGKHRLFPRVSPKKSWEGAIAGFVFSILSVIAAKYIVLDFIEWNQIIGIGLIVGVFGQIGDLIESLLKRDADVKDSSSILPGHGGFFDRFDSLIFSAPIIYLFLYYTT